MQLLHDYVNRRGDSRRPLRVLFLSYHPAHYRDATLSVIQQSRVVELDVAYLFESADYWHPYWQAGSSVLEYSVLKTWLTGSPNRHFCPAVIARVAMNDVVFVTGLTHWTSRLALAASLSLARPLVFVSDMTAASVSPRQRAMMRALSRVVSAVWVPGKASKSLWIEEGLPSDRVFEGCYCLDASDLRRKQDEHPEWREDQRRALGVDVDDPVALFVGRMVAQRDIPCLLTSFDIASKSVPRARLVVVGAGPLRSWAEEFCRLRGLSGVTFVDPMRYEELPPLYAAADVYIQPSSLEPYSLSAAQAATMGLPVVSSDAVGAAADYVVDGVTGLLVRSGDSKAMSDALCRLLTDLGAAAKMGESARQLAAGRSVEWAAREFVRAALKAGDLRVEAVS